MKIMMLRNMKALVLTLVASVVGTAALGQDVLPIGGSMPLKSKALPSTTGSTASIASVAGENGTLVMFWCNTCPWVKRYEDRMVALGEEYAAKGIGIIAINPNDAVAYPGDSMDEMKKQAEEHGYSFPYVADPGSEVAVAFGAKRTPQAFLFNTEDVLVYQGAFDDSPSDAGKVEADYLRDALDALLSGSPIALTETKAFGCTIKFQ
jgi:thiol-disulfide isomerase/thioredoxin